MSFAPLSAVREGPSHLPGVTRLTYSRDGATIFTGGSDCMLRYHNVHEPDSEPGFFDEHRDPITCIATTSSNLITGCEDGITRSFAYPANEFEGNLARSSGVAVRWLAIDRTGEKVAVCSEDLLVKVINIRDPLQISVLPGLARPVRSATWHSRQDMLTIVTTDGKIQVYEFLDGNASCLKTIEAMAAPGKPDDELPCAVAWHPKGDFFVVPTRSHDIAIVDRDSWTRQGNFSASGHDGEIGLLAWSPNGLYLASSGKDDQIIVWETESRRPVSRVKVNGGTVTGLEFSPKDNALSWACADGTFNTWTEPVPADKPHPAEQPRVHATRQQGLGDEGDSALPLDDDEDFGEDLADYGNDDWLIDDEGSGGQYKEREASPGLGNGVREVVGITKAQPAFQPGSTSMRNKKRYLAFNMIGVVDVTDQDTHHVVNVEFHDKSADRRGYHFQDHNRFHLAAVGEQGIVYGSAAEGDLPSLIHYRAYDTWASGADWQVSLPAGEEPILLAVGGRANSNEFDVENASMGSVVVATSRGFIRFFSGSGVQRYLWRMGEDMVSMVASTEMVLLVHREGGTSLDGCQNLRYTLIDLETYDIVQEGRLPLPRRTVLKWVGFSQTGAPAMYDSDGMLSISDRSRRRGQARWAPLVDTKALVKKEGGNQTSYWPVGVNDSQMMCVVLKGNEREPYFPRPVILDVGITMPLLNMDISQGQLEEKLLREQLQLTLLRDIRKDQPDSPVTYGISKIEVSQDKELIQLVQAACKADKLQRALDVVRMMNNVKSMEAAAKVAQFYHLPGLQEKIGIIREATEERRREKERSEHYGSYRMVARETPVPDSPYGAPSRASVVSARYDTEFAPRTVSSKRTARASVGTPVREPARYVSETPEPTGESSAVAREDLSSSPNSKRRRLNDTANDDAGFKRPQLPGDNVISEPVQKVSGLKNPFARKTLASNPFAKSNIVNTTQAKKSYSFFEKVEDAQNAAKNAAAKANGTKERAKKAAKQTTLSLAPKAPVSRPSLQSEDSLASTVVDSIPGTPAAESTDVDMDDTLEETQIEEAPLQASPENLDETNVRNGDDDEPLEWEDSDNEDAGNKSSSLD